MTQSSKLLCPLQTIKENSLIEENAEPLKLRAAALDAQRVELRSVLGAALTDHFLSAVQDDGSMSGLTSVQQTFYSDFLIPLFSKYTEAAFVYSSHYRLSNLGVQQTTTDKSQPASDQAVRDMYKRTMNQADYFAQRAKTFICLPENYEDLGRIYQTTQQNIPPAKNVNQGFIYLGD